MEWKNSIPTFPAPINGVRWVAEIHIAATWRGTAPISKVPIIAGTGQAKIDLGDAILPLYECSLATQPLLFHYTSDHINSGQIITDAAGQVVWQGEYSPFGDVNVVVNSIENNFRFPGQYYDAETGLHYNWHRFYDPDTGRYISADPIGLTGGMNLYAYAGGNPVNLIDPDGKNPLVIGTIGVGGVAVGTAISNQNSKDDLVSSTGVPWKPELAR